MRKIWLVLIVCLGLGFQAYPLLADDVHPIPDPDDFALETTTQVIGDVSGAVDKVVTAMGNSSQRDILLASLKTVPDWHGGIIDKVWDKSYGTTLHQIIYTVATDGKGELYFRYNFKRWPKGWILANFAFKSENQQIFPPEWQLVP